MIRRKITLTPIPVARGEVFTLPLGDGPVEIDQGDLGWADLPRPHRRTGQEWTGTDSWTLTAPFMYDAWKGQGSVEAECRRLERAGMKVPSEAQPTIYALAGPIPKTELRWVIKSIGWGKYERRDSDGQRARQEGVVVFREWVEVGIITSPARRAVLATLVPLGGAAPSPGGKLYTAKSGDTLAAIAARELGDASRWPEILDAATGQPIRDPRTLAVGQELRLP